MTLPGDVESGTIGDNEIAGIRGHGEKFKQERGQKERKGKGEISSRESSEKTRFSDPSLEVQSGFRSSVWEIWKRTPQSFFKKQ
jgi:hypothetical protein